MAGASVPLLQDCFLPVGPDEACICPASLTLSTWGALFASLPHNFVKFLFILHFDRDIRQRLVSHT